MATSDHRHPSRIAISIGAPSVLVFVNTFKAPPPDHRPAAPRRGRLGAAPRHGLASMLARTLPRPSEAGGAFIARHAPFDVFAELARLVASARSEILIVDPYVNAIALTDVAIAAREGVRIQILGDRAGAKSSLAPAAGRWQAQYKAARPLEVRLARAKSLHDRLLLIDRAQVWNLSQSIADFARTSPASIERSSTAIEKEKALAYLGLWMEAAPLA